MILIDFECLGMHIHNTSVATGAGDPTVQAAVMVPGRLVWKRPKFITDCETDRLIIRTKRIHLQPIQPLNCNINQDKFVPLLTQFPLGC